MYKEEMSTLAMMISGGRGVGLDRILSRKWLVFWIWEGRDLTKVLWKFRTVVRRSGKVEVGGKRWFFGNKGWGWRWQEREAAASTDEIDAVI